MTQSYWEFVDGHDLITATIKVTLPGPIPRSDITFRAYASIDSAALNKQLHSYDWSVFDDSPSVAGMTLCLSHNLYNAINISVPVWFGLVL